MHAHHLLHILYQLAVTYFNYVGYVFLVTLLLISAFWGFLTALDVLLLGIRKLWQRIRSKSHNGYSDYQAEVYRLRLDVALSQLATANDRLAAYEYWYRPTPESQESSTSMAESK